MKTLQLTLTLLLSLAVSGYSQDKVKKVKFEISGGKIVECPVSDAGPIPAESGPYKVEVAGIMLNREEDEKDTSLIFTYQIKVLPGTVPTKILIEDVTDAKSVVLVKDEKPKLEKGLWSANAEPQVVSKKSSPWIYDGKATIKIYRVTISSKNKPNVMLYQPSWYAASSKELIIKATE